MDMVVAIGFSGKRLGAEGACEGFERFGEVDSQMDVKVSSLCECARAVGTLERFGV